MDKTKARSILPLVNNPETMAMIKVLVEMEAEIIYKSIPNTTDEVQLRMLQGKLQQLERFKNIDERVREAAK